MRRLKSSIVAWSLGGVLATFAGLYYILPYDRLLDLALAVAFGVAFAGTIRYGRDALLAARSGKSGAEFLLVAVFAMFSVIMGQRVWGIVLRVLDRPDWLVDSPITILVPVMMSWAMSLALVAPDIDLEPATAKSNLWRSVALFIGGALAGFVVAASFGVKDSIDISRLNAWPQLINRPTCPKESVWVSSTGIYHTYSSPYRGSVVPRYCFESEEKAREAGFKAPK